MKLLIAALTLTLMTGCIQSSSNASPKSLTTYIVDGKPLDCLVLVGRLSCNWELYND